MKEMGSYFLGGLLLLYLLFRLLRPHCKNFLLFRSAFLFVQLERFLSHVHFNPNLVIWGEM